MPTLRDVARLAGFSTATVSHVINGSKGVKSDTRERVESAIAQLGFVPDAVGRSLARKRNAAALVLPRKAFVESDSDQSLDSSVSPASVSSIDSARTMLRIVHAAQPISRADLARRLKINRSTVTEIVKPLLASGALCEAAPERGSAGRIGRPPIGLSLCGDRTLFIGVNIGVRRTQVGAAATDGRLLADEAFDTPADADASLARISSIIERLQESMPERTLISVGVTVPGPTDAERKELLFAPHLGWREVRIAETLNKESKQRGKNFNVPVIVDNDATAAAMYEARRHLRNGAPLGSNDFVLVRAGTGIGVGLVLGGEVYRGAGTDCGLLGEFGHMTIVAGGKQCACGNRGCWELYASATSAASLYAGDRASARGHRSPRFVEVVARAEAGELRAQATLARIGGYLGIGISNVITGLGVSRVVVSGRIVHGWKFVQQSLREAVAGSMVGRLSNWSVEQGQPTGAGLGGALEVAIEHYLTGLAESTRAAA
ncbi:MAG: Transcriptional regulator/sugar kinase [Acidobacteria bacterium]|nr:Transcriptional regulator/sugar kinase [Acidobacteriota bacterium]